MTKAGTYHSFDPDGKRMPFDRSIFDDINTNLSSLEIDQIKQRLDPMMIGYSIETPIFAPGARSGPWRPGFPVEGGHRFRWMTTTCSGRWRPGQQGCGRA